MFSKWLFEQRSQRGQCPVEHRGTFVCLSFVCPSIRPSQASNLPSQAWNLPSQALNLSSRGLKFALTDLKSALSGLKSALSDLKYALPALSSFKSAILGLIWLIRPPRPQICPFWPQISPLKLQISWIRLQNNPLRPQMSRLRQDKCKSPWVLQDIVPFKVAALLPLTPITQSKLMGIADHILPFGDLFTFPFINICQERPN